VREGEPGLATNGGEDMRRDLRVEYAEAVHTLSSIGNNGANVVLGSDLSLQGIRLNPHEGLTIESLRDREGESLVVSQVVSRND
jgi:hypothetical protein